MVSFISEYLFGLINIINYRVKPVVMWGWFVYIDDDYIENNVCENIIINKSSSISSIKSYKSVDNLLFDLVNEDIDKLVKENNYAPLKIRNSRFPYIIQQYINYILLISSNILSYMGISSKKKL